MSLKKRIISLASVVAFAISFGVTSLTANAEFYSEESTYGDIHYKKVDVNMDGIYDYVGISDCEQSATRVVIPEEIEDLPVKAILRYAFSNCNDLASIDIPDSVISIEERAFNECSSLTSLKIPYGVTAIEYGLFFGCPNLERVNIPEGVTSVKDGAFYGCNSLAEIEIPESVTSIGASAFYYCSSLSSITILNPECEINDNLYTIPDNTTIYGYSGSMAELYAQKYGKYFVAIDDQPVVTTPAVTTTTTCTTTTEPEVTTSVYYPIYTEKNTTTTPASSSQNVVTSISEVVVTDVSYYVFELPYETNHMGNAVTAISVFIFTRVSQVVVTVPTTTCTTTTEPEVTTSVYYPILTVTNATIPPASSSQNATTSISEVVVTDVTYYPGYTTTYITTRPPEYISEIHDDYFGYIMVDDNYDGRYDYIKISDCEQSATTIVIPETIDGLPVRSIGSYAFQNCGSLEIIKIPTSVITIEDYAFYNCDNLTIHGEAGSYAQEYALLHNIPFTPNVVWIKGDANLDGLVNIRDSAFIARMAEQDRLEELKSNADFNQDGIVNIRDAAEIAVYCTRYKKNLSLLPSTNPEGKQLSLSSAEGKPGEAVILNINVECDDKFESADFSLCWTDKNLIAAEAYGEQAFTASELGGGYVNIAAFGFDAINDGSIAAVKFTIPSDAKPGTVYNIYFSDINTFALFDDYDIPDLVSVSKGTITVLDEPEATTPVVTEVTTTYTTATTTSTSVSTEISIVTTAEQVIITDIENEGYITLNQKPSLTYKPGEKLNLAGLKISLDYYYGENGHRTIYDNVSPLECPEAFIVDTSSFDSSKSGTYTIKVYCTEAIGNAYHVLNKIYFDVTVSDLEIHTTSVNTEVTTISSATTITTTSTEISTAVTTESVIITDIENEGYITLNQKPSLTYKLGEKLNLAGLKISLDYYYGEDGHRTIYDNVSPLECPEAFIIDASNFDSSKSGTYTIKVYCTEAVGNAYHVLNKVYFDVTVSEEVSDSVKGDADGNNKTDIRDAAFIAKKVAQRKTELLPVWADYNNDSKLDILDAAAIAKDVAKRILR